MARQNINLGTAPGGLDGDDARTAFTKTNANFTELYGGTVLQPLNAKLSAISASVWAANQLMYTTGAGTVAMTALTAFARTLLDDADAATMRATLGALGIGDFGVGGKTIAAPSTLGSITTTGFYYCAATVTDGPIPSGTGAAQGHIIHVNHPSNGYAWQIFRSVSTPRTFERYQVAGNWGAWEERMSIGQYGLGSYAARLTPPEVDAAATIPSGFYDVVPSTVASWPKSPFPNAWTRLLNISHNNAAGYWTQLAFNFDIKPTLKVRGMSAGTLGDWSEVLTENNGVTLATTQEIAGQKTFNGAQIRHRSSTAGLWMSPSDGTSDEIWMVLSGNAMQWQRRANGFSSTLRSPTPMLIDLNANTVRFGYAPTPVSDNGTSLGGTSARWSTVYAATGTINTSDAREKTPVSGLTEQEIAAAKALSKEIGTYKWLQAVQDKGADARAHVGLTVQRAIEIMQENGLEPFEYGFICYDKWEATEDVVQAIRLGRVYIPATEDSEEVELYADVEESMASAEGSVWEFTHETSVVTVPGSPAGDRYSFRYDELNLFIAAGIEARLAALEDAIG